MIQTLSLLPPSQSWFRWSENVSRMNRRGLCWVLLLVFAVPMPMMGCDGDSGVKPGAPTELPPPGPPPIVKEMEKDMLKQKAKPNR